MGKAFALAELVIVVAIIGILAALVMPYFGGQVMEARETAARKNLQLLRNVIELYAADHQGVAPGYADNNPGNAPSADVLRTQILVEEHNLLQMPANPFNKLDRVRMIGNNEAFPAEATGVDGWIYQPATKVICLDWPGFDSRGVRYLDY